MTSSDRSYFEDFEIVREFETDYASGYVAYDIEEGVGGNYEGYDYEIVYHIEICEIHFYKLWHHNKETDDEVDILGKCGYSSIEEIAKEAIREKYE